MSEFHCCQGCYFYDDSLSLMMTCLFFCVHKSSRVVHQFSQGLEIGVSRGMRGPPGCELVLWSAAVFDRAAVIAPQRPRRANTIKTNTFKRDLLPNG